MSHQKHGTLHSLEDPGWKKNNTQEENNIHFGYFQGNNLKSQLTVPQGIVLAGEKNISVLNCPKCRELLSEIWASYNDKINLNFMVLMRNQRPIYKMINFTSYHLIFLYCFVMALNITAPYEHNKTDLRILLDLIKAFWMTFQVAPLICNHAIVDSLTDWPIITCPYQDQLFVYF